MGTGVVFSTDTDWAGEDPPTTGTVHNNVWKQAMATAVNNVIGDWTDVAFAAGNFTGNGAMTWTLTAPDQVALAYRKINKSLLVSFQLVTTTVGGTPNTDLRITIPAGLIANRTTNGIIYYSDNGTKGHGISEVNSAGTVIRLLKSGFTNWSAATNATDIYGQIEFQTTT